MIVYPTENALCLQQRIGFTDCQIGSQLLDAGGEADMGFPFGSIFLIKSAGSVIRQNIPGLQRMPFGTRGVLKGFRKDRRLTGDGLLLHIEGAVPT